ncbi:hypothetical protein ADIWIN_3167 [Winogradskyella psychrotolerans RS-3]|uniref:DUF4377 domain-containing protein n=1 Tax=Winogradskyella psychrotolerans RS-3 TaxID=641526 RepID=S7VNH1_9FLAO|nr:DUF4377 domain-containing protein [Winogradskyella psychrotolerans]EPR71720.1 hypothetical protein ADIWIN_3167 [Winogradskyella psychrotolerans RS-3]
MKKQILLLIIIGLFFSCTNDDDNDSQTVTMRINHYQNTAIALDPVIALLVQYDDNIGTTSWNNFYATIEGFNYVPGQVYDLSVRIDQIGNPAADDGAFKYTLLEVISEQEVPAETEFNINLKINGQNFITTDSGYQLLNQIDIDCNTLCDALDTLLESEDVVVGTFKHLDNNEIQLIELE